MKGSEIGSDGDREWKWRGVRAGRWRWGGDKVREREGQVALRLCQFFVEIAPPRVQLPDFVDFPLTFPLFHLLLSKDGLFH